MEAYRRGHVMTVIEPTQGYADSDHPSAEQLNAFVLGRLDEGSSADVERHVADCPLCGKWLETSPDDSFVALFQGAYSSTTIVGAAEPAAPSEPLRFVRGYQLLEVLGEGGMGIIWKARREGLDRFVALKRIRSTGQPSPEALARFHREAEAVSHLRHENIVQIYDVGEQDGEPYLALEYLEGGNLARKLSAGPLPPRQAAALVETLARAIHHAHQRGIIHRDLKPANILFDESSTAKISDFGLAKQLDEATAHTQTGAILGTPSYMAPEQAEGAHSAIGPAADVYSLGAILYEMLTGRPPFRGPTVLETLAQVRERDPVPPRQLQPGVPRDLETVCLECLQKEPRKRYPSAADLAEDLQRFREGRPVRARRAGFLERLGKWMRRRPALAALGAVSTLALASLFAGSLWYQAKLRLAVNDTEANRQRADRNYGHARQAINQMLDRLDKFKAPGVPEVGILRSELSKDALSFFQAIADTEADPDPATRLDFAKAYMLLSKESQPEEAVKILDHARRLLEELSAEEPANGDYRFELARCLDKLAVRAFVDGRVQKGGRLREQALEIRRELCRLEPDNANYQSALANSHINMGCSYENSNWEKAEFHWKVGIRIQEKLVREHPELLEYQYMWAIFSTNLALVYSNTGRRAEANAVYREVEPRLAKLVQEKGSPRDWLEALLQTLRCWGGNLIVERRGEEAGPLLDRAVAMADQWRLEDPQSRKVQELLLACLMGRMLTSTLLHRRDEGTKDWQRAVALSAELKSWSELCEGAVWDARLGDHALAAERAEYLAKKKDLTDDDVSLLAKAYALASAADRKDSELTPPEQERNADRYAAAAVALLNKLHSSGYFNDTDHLKSLQTDTDLDSLRQRDDFLKLVNETGKPVARNRNP